MYLSFDSEKEARYQHRRAKEETYSGNAVPKNASLDDRSNVLREVD
jgi:hypothetical protein